MIPDELRRQIAEQSLVSTGSAADWARIFAKKSLSLGFMGGSVTQGYINEHILENAYPALVSAALQKQGYSVTSAVCADAGMDTLTANLLAEQVILSQKPDLVFLEYAINETTLRHSVLAFESLLRRLLTAEHPPLVCVLLMRTEHGYSCDSYMEPIAAHYGLPCINLRYGLTPALDKGTLQWEEFADAESHPNENGHQVIADAVLHLIHAGKQQTVPSPAALPEPWLGAPFADMRQILPESGSLLITANCPVCPRQEWYFHSAWEITPKTGIWTLSGNLSGIVLFYETANSPAYGRCRVLLDGEPVRHPLLQESVLETSSIYGWGNARDLIVLCAKDAAPHTLTLEPLSGTVYLLSVGVCRE